VPGYVVAARYHTISKIQDVVSRWYEPRRARRGQMYEVRAFGSTEYGVDSPQSDLDLVIVVSESISVHEAPLTRVAGPFTSTRAAPTRGQEADAG
jgi:DNA polymerase sigma